MAVGGEALYQWIYRDAKAGGEWYQHLWHPHRQYRHLRFRLRVRVSLSHRPEVANLHQRIGDWEGDSVCSWSSR